MSERLHESAEKHQALESLADSAEKRLQELETEARPDKHETVDLAALEASAEQQSISAHEVTVGEKDSTPQYQQHLGAHRELKAQAYERTLAQIQSRLSRPEKLLSKTLHQPFIDNASNLLAKSAARPSGVMGAGICALIGSSILIYMSRRYGFEYNYTAFLFLVMAGFGLGLLIELLVRAVHKPRH